MKIDIKSSFTAADSLPIKTLMDAELIHSAKNNNRLIPIHIQLIPTNKCNLNCKFCSCSNRDQSLEMDYITLCDIIIKCKDSTIFIY